MKLEIKHLAPYLPYGLKAKFQAKNKKTCRKYVIGTISVMYSDCSICCYDTVNATPDQFKPILRPLSDLTKEIEIDGKKFVPMDELGKLFDMNVVEYCFISQNLDRHKLIQKSIGYSVAEKLFEWHFDVFGLIDQGLALPLMLGIEI